MTHRVKNQSRFLVTLRGNSGESWHLPPTASIELPDFEVIDNAMFHKLREQHLIAITRAEGKKESEPFGDDKGRKARPTR